MLELILLILLILFVLGGIGTFPAMPYMRSRGMGYGPTGLLWVIAIALLVIYLIGARP